MKNKDDVVEVIFLAIDEVNRELPVEERLEKSLDTPLYGTSGSLDSLGIIDFIAFLEEKASERFGFELSLIDEDTMENEGPLRTIGTLSEYLSLALEKYAQGDSES